MCRILRVYWISVISNAHLWSDTDQQPIEREMRRCKWGWIGHTFRKSLDDITTTREAGASDDHRTLRNYKS